MSRFSSGRNQPAVEVGIPQLRLDISQWERHSVLQIGLSCIRMGSDALAAKAFPLSDNKGNDASKSPTLSLRASAVTQPLVSKNLSTYTVCLVLNFAMTYVGMVSAIDTFSLDFLSFSCSSNIICLRAANVQPDDEPGGGLYLTSSEQDRGVAYYNQQVKLLDVSTRQSASFSSTFTISSSQYESEVSNYADGMAFVISASNSFIGGNRYDFGIFREPDVKTPFKSIIVEFDSYQNTGYPVYDISDNHVSIDFANITAVVAKNASDVDVHLWSANLSLINVWVDYSNDSKQLEVRMSHVDSRPASPLLNTTVTLSDVVEEFMWVGFSTGDTVYNWIIRNWTFTSSLGFAPTSQKFSMIWAVSLVAPALVFFCILIVLFRRRTHEGKAGYGGWKVRSARFTKEDEVIQIEGMLQRYRCKELSIATKAFSEESKLGEGGFGSVFRGVLPSSGTSVAVKKISGDSKQGEKEFMAEVSIISQLRHRNLIQLLGWCKDASKGMYLLVYELMPNASLDKVLFGQAGKQIVTLSWTQRFNIVTGPAAALDYLHQGWKQQVIHRDIKSSNIMLDEGWNAKLGDFGLARLVDHKKEATTTIPAGTRGYLAPEVAFFGKFTDKSDVFAFGAVVLEVTCGRKALSFDVPEDERLLVDWVWHSLCEGDIMRTVDQRLKEYDTGWMEVLLTVGLCCSHPDPEFRPSMRQVVEVLAGNVAVPSIPLCKPALVFSSIPQNIFSSEMGSETGF